MAAVDPEIQEQVSRDALYANYIGRQQAQIDAMKKDEAHEIPAELDYNSLDGLSNELKSKLSAARPENLAQASRVEGVTPAALALLFARLKRGSHKKSA